jgi:peptidoglycan-associated lipoprotein
MLVVSGIAFISGCHKRVASSAAPPAPPPAPAAPTVMLNASPTDITKGGSSTLTWSSSNATRLILSPEVGGVSLRGSAQVSPSESTTYTITASGAGGKAEATARVTVSTLSAATVPSPGWDLLFDQNIKDVFFDYDKADISEDAREALSKDAEFLNVYSGIRISIEGDCDERGSEEYNLGLGDRRAASAKRYLVILGIAENRMLTTSLGKERPFCSGHNEACWRQNRRAHLVMIRSVSAGGGTISPETLARGIHILAPGAGLAGLTPAYCCLPAIFKSTAPEKPGAVCAKDYAMGFSGLDFRRLLAAGNTGLYMGGCLENMNPIEDGSGDVCTVQINVQNACNLIAPPKEPAQ